MTTHDPAIPSTTESGAPRESDAHSLSVGPDGPLMLHDVALVQKLARFDRERVPERSPHAKGSGAFGGINYPPSLTCRRRPSRVNLRSSQGFHLPTHPGSLGRLRTRIQNVPPAKARRSSRLLSLSPWSNPACSGLRFARR